MSSVVKVNLITELGLLPLKRYIQRKPDNYHEAVQSYTAQLDKLYRLSLQDERKTLASQKRAVESETFRLDCAAGELNGITIDRQSLPRAELGDRIILIRQDESVNEGEPLTRGVIVKTTEQQIRIKFQEAIFKKPADQSDGPRESVAGPSEAEQENEVKSKPDGGSTTKSTTVDFKIRFDTKQDSKMIVEDNRSRLVEAVLANFGKLKCNQAIQRSLLGFYDERSDTLNDKARVMAFTELVVKLNNQQRSAIEHALKRRLTLIEGPAGTGKTVVGAHIAANLARQRRARVLVCSPIQETVDKITELIDRVGGIQVVKLPTRTQTSDQQKTRPDKCNGDTRGRRCSYLGSETARSNHCHLDKLVEDEIYLQAYTRFKDTIGNNHDKLHAQAYRMVISCPEVRRRELETKLLSKADVVCCKIDLVSSSILKGVEFDVLILDDVQATSELDCLIAIMTKGIKQVTLLSDTRRDIRLARILSRSQSVCNSNNVASAKQQVLKSNQSTNSLRRKRQDTMRRRHRQVSTVSDNIAVQSQRAGISPATSPLNVSLEPGNLFERLLSLGLPTVDLRIQYRCHATLSNFFIHHFYAGRLKDDTETNDKMSTEIVTRLVTEDDSFSWLPNKKYLTAIYKVPANSTGDANRLEVERFKVIEERVASLVDRLTNDGVRRHEYTIGIIYNSQAQWKFSEGSQVGVKRGTIDKFIGQECDFAVLVANKNCESLKLDQTNVGICTGITCDFRRSDITLNWALTRARLGLLIVLEGDEKENNSETVNDLQNDDCRSWRELVKYYAANDLIME